MSESYLDNLQGEETCKHFRFLETVKDQLTSSRGKEEATSQRPICLLCNALSSGKIIRLVCSCRVLLDLVFELLHYVMNPRSSSTDEITNLATVAICNTGYMKKPSDPSFTSESTSRSCFGSLPAGNLCQI
ncbi:hypothetical protein MRB53_020515 [Persea americana]|uniref:Uncharacterized protein n=1 Tax=Persea americana TaxID=3435 RepID=A0ACC2L2I8_PERAE|nr:hypothetical protein MRB53_020515 [Persea americana]